MMNNGAQSVPYKSNDDNNVFGLTDNRFISMHQILGWIINFERFDPLVQQFDFLM